MTRLKLLLLSIFLVPLIACNKNLGLFSKHRDIGKPSLKGNVVYQDENDTYIISGGGMNMWFGEDQFHYLWKKMEGDFKVSANIEFVGDGVDPHRKAGWIIKNDLKNNTPHVNACIHGDGLTSLQYRKLTGGDTEEAIAADIKPDAIQLERRGDLYIMSSSKMGAEMMSIELPRIQMEEKVHVGLYVCSHNANVVETVKFSNVQITSI